MRPKVKPDSESYQTPPSKMPVVAQQSVGEAPKEDKSHVLTSIAAVDRDTLVREMELSRKEKERKLEVKESR